MNQETKNSHQRCVVNFTLNFLKNCHLGFFFFSEIQLWWCIKNTCINFYFHTLFILKSIHFHSTCYSYNMCSENKVLVQYLETFFV